MEKRDKISKDIDKKKEIKRDKNTKKDKDKVKDKETKKDKMNSSKYTKEQKKEVISIVAIVAAVIPILALIGILCLNRFELKLSVEDGQEIFVEYGEKDVPEVTAVYKGNLINPKGTFVDVAVDGEVDFEAIGTYTLTYSADRGRETTKATVKVVVEDTKPPKIELVSNPDYFTSPIAQYVEEGFSAKDNFDGDLTDKVQRVEKDGVVTYSVSDSNGNSTTVKRKIVYKDVVAPIIELNSGIDFKLNVGTEFVEPGFSATDDCDGDITANVKVEGTVDFNKCGTYLLKYNVADSYGNVCELIRNVTVNDFQAPSISLKGGKNAYVKRGSSYSDPGFSAKDNVDGDVTGKVVCSGSIDTSKVGMYDLKYSVTDAAGNVSTVTRKVYVYEKQMISNAVNPGNKVVYLTFDDGPGAHTERLLDILDKYNVKVTFFVTNQRSAYANLIGESYRRGHTIALHTYTHKYSIYKSEETYYADLKKIDDLVFAQTGKRATIVRFPGGTSNRVSTSYSKGIMTTLAKSIGYHGYLYCDWNVSSGDAGGTTSTSKVAANVISGMKKHNVSIVLQHDIHGYSVNAVEEIIVWGLTHGYTFLPMDETTPMVHHHINN